MVSTACFYDTPRCIIHLTPPLNGIPRWSCPLHLFSFHKKESETKANQPRCSNIVIYHPRCTVLKQYTLKPCRKCSPDTITPAPPTPATAEPRLPETPSDVQFLDSRPILRSPSLTASSPSARDARISTRLVSYVACAIGTLRFPGVPHIFVLL